MDTVVLLQGFAGGCAAAGVVLQLSRISVEEGGMRPMWKQKGF